MPQVLAFVLLLSLTPVLCAQSTRASLTGRITDPLKALIVGAKVAALSNSTNVRYETTTNGSGEYYLANLPPGLYRIEVEKPGFKKIIKPDVILHVQDALEIDFEMTLGDLSETIAVAGGAPLTDTESGAVSTVIDRTFVENLPLNGRSFQTLIMLTPGVVLTATAFNDQGQFSVNGQRADANYFSVDGVSANFGVTGLLQMVQTASGALPALSASGGTNSLVSVDAMQEFRVQTSSFAPEFGRTPGGQISIVTRSGTNAFHGTLTWCPSALGLNSALDVSQYAHTSWKIRDGFSKSAIRSIAQTHDGYLWLGTESGLLRFDGVRTVAWQPPADQSLPSSFIFSLLASRDGTLWIGTSKGLASWKDGKLTLYAELAGQNIFRLLEDREGTVWVGGVAPATGRLCAIRNGSVQCYGEDGRFGRGVVGLYEDGQGNLWAGTEPGLWRWRPGSPNFYPLPGEPDGIQGFAQENDGSLLIGTSSGVRRFVDGKTEAYALPGVPPSAAPNLLRDRDGNLWIGTYSQGLVHAHQGRADVFAPSDGLSGELVHTLFEDREGNIWVGTKDGLDRFRDFAVATFTVKQGLSHATVVSVLSDRDGSVWLATDRGLNRWTNGQIATYGKRGAQPGNGTQRNTGGDNRDGRLKGLDANSLFQDDRGRIWVSTLRGFGYLENDEYVSIKGIPGGPVTSIAQDTAGNLWIANERSGLYQLSQGRVARQIPWAALGHQDPASALAADPLRGGLWIGFALGGVAYFNDNQVRASYAAADGLAEGRVNHFRLDQDGSLWAATDGGLSRLKNDGVATLTSKHGLPCDTVHWTIEDDADSFWLYTACGLVRIAHAEMYAWVAAADQNKEAKPAIQPTVFDTADGVRILASGGHFSPQVAKSSDGKLWFLPWDGVSVVDPRNLSFNQLPPPVHIEQITADRKTYDANSGADGRLSLPPLVRDLEINYTALSLVAPEKIVFRYKLEGHDSDWQEVGNRRQAFYNDLPPGNYRFRVTACNNNGAWNETGTYFDFAIAPAYYQTTWFSLSLAAALLILLATLYQLRLRQVARQVQGRMEARLEERERIARDLHDTLLQSVQGLILKFAAVTKQIRHDDPAHDALEKTLDQADRVLAEGRDRVRNLRVDSESLSDLPAAFHRVAEETPQARKTTLKTVTEGSVRELHPIVLHESYSIGREALVNALTHSDGRHVEVEITYDSRQFRLRVRDDGRGIDPGIVELGGRPGHWGLQGMRERAQKVGAELKLWSRAETGTEIELIVPGATAYKAAGDKSKSSWLSRIFRR